VLALNEARADRPQHKVALVCTSQGIDTSDANPAGRLVAHILMAIAQFERALISDRTRIGMKIAKANGARIGRRPAVLPANAAQILMDWRGSGGRNYRELARRLGVNVGTAYRYANATASSADHAPSPARAA
jgi:DNA invertase Pin-like site-specific DNA recombinase